MKTKAAGIIVSFLLFFFAGHLPIWAATDQRVALVIGNSSYSTSPLANPVNDANDMASALRRLGFYVILKKNANLKEMDDAVRDFGERLRRAGTGLFFYAGHGVQINGKNYLIPIGARIQKETDVKYQAIDAEIVLDEMANAGNSMNIVILDACRDNPFARSFRSASRGLAIISSAPKGTFITYSTSPGKVASDGTGRNSPYTESLIKYITVPDIPIEEVFKKVRQEIGRKTKNQQVPWELSSLEGSFYFNPQKTDRLSDRVDTGMDKAAQDYEAERIRLDEERQRLQKEKELLEQKKALAEEERRLKEERSRLERERQQLAYIPKTDIAGGTRFIPRVNGKITKINFFERGADQIPKDKRVYRRNFSRTQTRFIEWELTYECPQPGRRIDFRIEEVWYDPKGNEISRTHADSYILETWTNATVTHGFGWRDASSAGWTVGTHRVDFYVDGEKVASETFGIY